MIDTICNRLFAAAPLVMAFAVFAAIGCTPSREPEKLPTYHTTTVYIPVYQRTNPPSTYSVRPKRGNPIDDQRVRDHYRSR